MLGQLFVQISVSDMECGVIVTKRFSFFRGFAKVSEAEVMIRACVLLMSEEENGVVVVVRSPLEKPDRECEREGHGEKEAYSEVNWKPFNEMKSLLPWTVEMSFCILIKFFCI